MLLEAVIAQEIKERKEVDQKQNEQVLQLPVEPISYIVPETKPETSRKIEIDLA